MVLKIDIHKVLIHPSVRGSGTFLYKPAVGEFFQQFFYIKEQNAALKIILRMLQFKLFCIIADAFVRRYRYAA